MKLINIGFGNMISAGRLIAIVSPESAPIKRMVQEARDRGVLIDATYGRRTRAVLIMDNDHLVLSALQPETLANRLGDKDITLTDEEVAAIGVETKQITLEYEIGDSVKVTAGPLKGFVGTVEEISEDKKKIKVLVSMFGRETPIELDSESAEKLY